jgi:hypothetical protein
MNNQMKQEQEQLAGKIEETKTEQALLLALLVM